MADVNTAFVLISLIIFVGFAASKIFERYRLPDPVVLMLLGVLIGPVFGVLGQATTESIKSLSSFFGTLVLVILLLEGGMNLDSRKVLKEAAPATLFAFVAFIGSVFFIGAVAVSFGWSLLHGLLLGSILGGNSSSVVMSLVRKINIKEDTRTVLSLESSINDSLVIVTTIFILQVITTGGSSTGEAAQDFFGAFTISSLFAVAAGAAWIKILNVLKTQRYNYLLTLAMTLLLYVFTEGARSNGAFAALVFGIVVGNAHLLTGVLNVKEDVAVRWNLQLAQEEITFFVRTFFFAFLGMILDFNTISLLTVTMAMLIIGAKAMARYWAARMLARVNDEFVADEKVVASMLPNGLAAAAMASYPATFGITFGGEDLFLQVAFLVIFLSNIFASTAIFWIERRRG